MSSESSSRARIDKPAPIDDERIKRQPNTVAGTALTFLGLEEFFSPRPLLAGEDESAYDELLAKALATTHPADAIEMIWVRNAVDLIWEAQRLRRLKTRLLSEARTRAIAARLKLDSKLTAQWRTGDPKACAAVAAKLDAEGLTWDAMTGQVFLNNLTEFERLERLIASADARWERALTNIARRRQDMPQELRRIATATTAQQSNDSC